MDPPLPSVDRGIVVRGGTLYIILPNDRAEPSDDFDPAVRAEEKRSDRPRSGQRTMEAQSGQSAREQFQ